MTTALQPKRAKGESGMEEERAMEIPVTKVQLHPVDLAGPTKAIGSVTLGGCFVVHGVRVVQSAQNGLFVAMPQRKEGDGYRDVAHPITGGLRARLSSAVLEAFQKLQEREVPGRER